MFKKLLLAASIGVAVPSVAQAQFWFSAPAPTPTVEPTVAPVVVGCSSSNITMTATIVGYQGCLTFLSTNTDPEPGVGIVEDIGIAYPSGSPWTYNNANKSDGAGNGIFTSNPGGTTGTLTFDQAMSGWFAIGLKFGNDVGVYVFNATNATSFAFSSFNGNGLSHAAYYDGTGNTQVPEPASFALVAAGLAGLGVVARRRRNKA